MKNLWPQEEGPEQTELMKQCFSVNQVKGLQTPTMVRFESPPSSFITVAQAGNTAARDKRVSQQVVTGWFFFQFSHRLHGATGCFQMARTSPATLRTPTPVCYGRDLLREKQAQL